QLGRTAQLAPGEPGETDEGAGIDFDDQAARARRRIEWPYGHPPAEPVQQPHPRKARLGDLAGADRVVDGRGLAAAGRVEGMLAGAVVEEGALHPVGGPEIEMAAVVV